MGIAGFVIIILSIYSSYVNEHTFKNCDSNQINISTKGKTQMRTALTFDFEKNLPLDKNNLYKSKWLAPFDSMNVLVKI
jgi:hypothetical protein